LQFVDTAQGHYGLPGLLRKYAIECIAPEQVASRLAGVTGPDSRAVPADPRMSGNLAAWAAGLCLCPDGADYDTSMALLEALKLDCSAWQYEALKQDSGSASLIWPPERRADLLNWLTFSETFEIGETQNRSATLQRALDFWKKRYEREIDERERSEQSPRRPWSETRVNARIRLEVAFLDLWERPGKAEQTLSRLRGAFEREIRERLGFYAPRNFAGHTGRKDRIHLPWRSDEIDQSSLSRLLELGFAKDWKSSFKAPRISGGFGFASGVFAGMIVAGCFQLLELHSAPPRILEDDPIFHKPAFRAGIIDDRTMPESPIWKPKPGADLLIGTAKQLGRFTADPGQAFQIRWQKRWLPDKNPRLLGLNQVWYAGSLAQPIRACASGWPRRSLIVIEADPENDAARKLAAALLDKGSADKVLLGRDWAGDLDEFIEIPLQATEKDQLILIAPERAGTGVTRQFRGTFAWILSDRFTELQMALLFPGVRKADEAWGKLVSVQTQGPKPVVVRGGPDRKSADNENPLAFVEVCGGTFSMGSDSGDEDETPVHAVTVDSFWIAETEVTNAQYRQYKTDWPENDERPAFNVPWPDAKRFCERYGYRLPSEAEWEYAARGGSQTDWSFGGDEKALGDHAWYGGNSGHITHPVKTRKPNPLGIYDMHGNIWEWVGDCYDENFYQKQSEQKLSLNPDNQSSECVYRGLRGGSAWNGPGFLRSASRDWRLPEFRFVDFGFRCVRSPAASD
ncbi:MAG: formylglycine-generating enzyme family protein, partial [Methylococcaceae bacterium]|nr:formylglycine-generating enzyme family protein [Methylococcaceae bacterium]